MAKEKHSSGPKKSSVAGPISKSEAQRRLTYAASALKVWADVARCSPEDWPLGEEDDRADCLYLAFCAAEDELNAVHESWSACLIEQSDVPSALDQAHRLVRILGTVLRCYGINQKRSSCTYEDLARTAELAAVKVDDSLEILNRAPHAQVIGSPVKEHTNGDEA